MAEQSAVAKAAEAVEKVTEKAVEAAAAVTPVEAKAAAPTAKAAPAAAKRSAPKAKRVARAARPAKRKQAARPAAKAQPAKAPAAARTSKPVRAGANRIKGVKTMNKQTRDTIDTGLFAADQFKTVFGDVNERAKAAAERSAKIAEELADLTRGNVEAFVASSKIAAKGVEALSQDAAEYSRKSFEEASAALKSFAEVKSATDFFKLQGDFARAAFDNVVAESARVSETVLKIAGDVAQPITSRYTVAAERVKTLAA
ncbi:MAG TPA: phasin family protein [Allosphingosinicella sp.]|nr:phasin family protein [Allosphingosinicella sp.]